jgi:hypothetical protein
MAVMPEARVGAELAQDVGLAGADEAREACA